MQMTIEPNLCHLLVDCPANLSPEQVQQRIKRYTAGKLRKEFHDIVTRGPSLMDPQLSGIDRNGIEPRCDRCIYPGAIQYPLATYPSSCKSESKSVVKKSSFRGYV